MVTAVTGGSSVESQMNKLIFDRILKKTLVSFVADGDCLDRHENHRKRLCISYYLYP